MSDKFSIFDDGEKWINFYSAGETELGRNLSHFTHRPFKIHNKEFASLEGYWHWLKLKMVVKKEMDFLQCQYGKSARSGGRFYRKELTLLEKAFFSKKSNNDKFWKLFKEAAIASITSDQNLVDELVNSKLPFKHYYLINFKPIEADKDGYVCKMYEDIRKELKKIK